MPRASGPLQPTRLACLCVVCVPRPNHQPQQPISGRTVAAERREPTGTALIISRSARGAASLGYYGIWDSGSISFRQALQLSAEWFLTPLVLLPCSSEVSVPPLASMPGFRPDHLINLILPCSSSPSLLSSSRRKVCPRPVQFTVSELCVCLQIGHEL